MTTAQIGASVVTAGWLVFTVTCMWLSSLSPTVAEVCTASIYWGDPETSSGETPNDMIATAAHKTIPCALAMDSHDGGTRQRRDDLRPDRSEPSDPGGDAPDRAERFVIVVEIAWALAVLVFVGWLRQED